MRAFASINGLRMHYQIEGSGEPLVYVPPVFGCVGMSSFPSLTRSYKVITVDQQGHGLTEDIPDRPLTLEQNAEDIAALLKYLGIERANLLGESYGGNVAALLASRHPQLVSRVATYGATFGPPAEALDFERLRTSEPPSADSPAHQFQRSHYSAERWLPLWNKVMGIRWNGLSDEELARIEAPLLIALGDSDFVRLEHAVATYRRVRNAELAVIPDAGHFALFSEPGRVLPVVEHFLQKPAQRLPIGTGESGYLPGKTR